MEQEEAKQQAQKPSWQQKPSYSPVPSLPGTEPAAHQQPLVHTDLGAKHQESARKHPGLRLSNDEYVILEVRRHPIGLVSIWGIVAIILVAVFALLPLYSVNMDAIADAFLLNKDSLPSPSVLAFPLLAIAGLFFLAGGYIATYVYQNNRFYLTNESIIQVIQLSLFSKKEQHINLANIEDASYRQQGIIQHLFGYGALRLSTEGDETTYRFHFVANPQYVVRQVIEAMENATGNAARFRSGAQEPIPIGKH